MRSHPLAFLALTSAIALGGCDAAPEDTATAGAEADASVEPASATRREPSAPKSRAAEAPQKMAGDDTRVDDATANAPVADAPKEPLRFDMTQGGEAQTAENFEQWMDAQGVRVAEGNDGADAGATVDAGAARTEGDAGADVQAPPQATRR